MKNFKNWVILILLGLTIYLCFRIYQNEKYQSNQLKIPTVTTDTIHKKRSDYQETKPYKNSLNPQQLIIYDESKGSRNTRLTQEGYLLTDTTSSAKVNPLSSFIGVSDPFLYDSISQIIIKNNWLELTTKNTLDSTYKIRKFHIDTEQYNYNWLNNELTYKKKFSLRLIPYIKGSYRPFNNFTDLEAGINLETKKFNYNLGLNLFYYPSLQRSVGKDLQISITYKFN